MQSLNTYLRQLRERRGLSTAVVIDRLAESGISKFTFYSWERGPARPEPENLGLLLRILEATPEERLVAYDLRALPAAKAA